MQQVPPLLSSAPRTAVAPISMLATTSDEDIKDEIIMFSDGGRLASELKVAVYGGGSFGTAMACVLGRKGIATTLVVRRPEVVAQINENHTNPYYQSDLLLPSAVRATTDAKEAFDDADFIIHAVPMQYSRGALEKVSHFIRPEVPVVSLSKGIETSTLCFMSDLLPQCLDDDQPLAYVRLHTPRPRHSVSDSLLPSTSCVSTHTSCVSTHTPCVSTHTSCVSTHLDPATASPMCCGRVLLCVAVGFGRGKEDKQAPSSDLHE